MEFVSCFGPEGPQYFSVSSLRRFSLAEEPDGSSPVSSLMKFDILHRRCIIRTEPHAAGGFPSADRVAPDLRMAREKRDERQEEEQEEEGEADPPEKGSQDQRPCQEEETNLPGFHQDTSQSLVCIAKNIPRFRQLADGKRRQGIRGRPESAGQIRPAKFP